MDARKAEDAASINETKAVMEQAIEQCAAEWRSADLDPIREKVAFRPGDASLKMLVNAERPTALEKKVIGIVANSVAITFRSCENFSVLCWQVAFEDRGSKRVFRIHHVAEPNSASLGQ
jgi:hypothetical protein